MCIKSLFMLHNETMNILSHFLPGIYFVIQLYLIATDSHCYKVFKLKQSSIIQAIECVAIIFCMFASATYHLFSPLSEWHYNLLLKIDLIGIGIMIFGLTLCAVYVGFHNYRAERDIILTSMSFLMAANLLI